MAGPFSCRSRFGREGGMEGGTNFGDGPRLAVPAYVKCSRKKDPLRSRKKNPLRATRLDRDIFGRENSTDTRHPTNFLFLCFR